MVTGRFDFKKLRASLEADARRQRDDVVLMSSLEMQDSPLPVVMFGKNGGPGHTAILEARAMQQLCAKISVPYGFVNRMSPGLRARTVNEFMERSAVDNHGDQCLLMLRMQKHEDGRMFVRAVLPGEYSPISHLHLLDMSVEFQIAKSYGLH